MYVVYYSTLPLEYVRSIYCDASESGLTVIFLNDDPRSLAPTPLIISISVLPDDNNNKLPMLYIE